LPKSAEEMSHEELTALKHKKKLITTATEQFNSKPAKGVSYLQEVGLVSVIHKICVIWSFISP